jgi:zinc protease
VNAPSLLSGLILGAALLGCSTSTTTMQTHETQTQEASAGSEAGTRVRAPAPGPSAPAEASAPHAARSGVFPYDVQRHQLSNGLKVILIPMPSEGLVSYWSVVRTGSRDEVEPGVTGFAHFFEHMMFRGSEKFPGPVYDGIVNGMGADANAFTTDDFTAYHLGFTRDDLPKVIEIEADRFQNLKYSEDEFKTESGAVYGEYRKGRTSPIEVLFEAVQNAAFDKHTYKHTTIGFEADIKRMPEQYTYSKGFFQRFYRPENVVVLVTGDFDPKQTLAEIEKRYSGWKPGYAAPKIAPEPPQKAMRRIEVPFEGKTLPILALNFKGERLLPNDRTMLAATLVGELCFGETSPVYKQLVLDEQRLDQLGSFFGFNRDPGLWPVMAWVKDPADVASVEGELWSALAQVRDRPVSQERLDAARSRLKYSFLTGLSTPSGVSQSLAQFIALTGDVSAVDEMYATMDQITPADVQKAVQSYLTPERCTVAVLHSAGEQLAKASSGSEPPVLMPVPADPNVAFKLWFKVGSQDDPPGKEGLASLTAAMMSEGATERLSYDQILEALFPLAAGYSVDVDKEMTVASGVVHRDKVDAFYGLFLDAILRPAFKQEDFERLRDSAVTSIEKSLRYSSDEELGKATLVADVFRGTPYAHLTDGHVASLKAITLQEVKDFHREHFTRDNLVIGLGGAYPETLTARLQADLARLPEGKPDQAAKPVPPPIQGRQVTIVQKAGPSTAISFGFPIDVHRGSREFYALWLANSWLGEHRNSSSHLYQVIREARGMNYGDYSYVEAYTNGGRRTMPPTGVGRRQQMFEVWIRPVPESLALSLAQTEGELAALAGKPADHIPPLFALRAALREVQDLAENGMTREEFEATRKFLSKYSLHFAETTGQRLGYAIDDRYYGLRESHLATFRRMMGELTLEEVNAALKKHLQVANLRIAIVTADAKGLMEKIAADAPSLMGYGKVTKPAAILAEDQEISRYPLRVPQANIRIVPVDEMFEQPDRAGGS